MIHMKELVLIGILIGVSIFGYGFRLEQLKETETSQTGVTLSRENLKGDNLTFPKFDGAILCDTTMPDGTINNSGCEK
jgi:hypothetical protein